VLFASVSLLLAIGLYLGFTAILKMRHHRSFLFAIASWQLLPTRYVRRAGRVFVFTEASLAVLLVAGAVTPWFGSRQPTQAAAIAGAVMLFVFTVGQIYVLRTAPRSLCGCHASSAPIGLKSVARAGGLAAVCLAVAVGL
jgi:hypothetical protein